MTVNKTAGTYKELKSQSLVSQQSICTSHILKSSINNHYMNKSTVERCNSKKAKVYP